MPTILKRDSENLAPVNTAPALKHSKSEVRSAYDRTADLFAAWGAGRFMTDSEGLDATIAEFFTEDVELDRSAAAHSGLDGYKVYHGHEGVKGWFEWLDAFDYEGLQMTFVAGPEPNEVFLRSSVERLINKKTGKVTPFCCVEVYTWEGSRCTKSVLSVFQPASVAAICSEEEHLPIPPFAQLPAFEPHPNPMEPWAEKMALWSAGDFYSEEGLLEEHTAEDAVCIVSDSAMPEVFRTYEGVAGVKEWNDHGSSLWELSNVALAPVAGLKPGCVLHRLTCDVKHKVTGKEAAGVQLFVECAYDVDGKFVYARHFFVNAPLLASIY